MLKIVLTVVHIIVTLSLIAIVLLQQGKTAGMSGAIAGGAETFFGKNKGRTVEAILKKWTAAAAIVFIITSLSLQFIK